MDKPVLRFKFVDMFPDLIPEKQVTARLIIRHYMIGSTSEPDYILGCVYGQDHLKYPNAVKILWTDENNTPDFNYFDYAIGCDHLSFGDRYVRIPLYQFYFGEDGGALNRTLRPAEKLVNRKFCSFVVSATGGAPLRFRFHEELSKYKRVDLGGRWNNNVGVPVVDKNEFLGDYKFTICFENSSSLGYTTEKLPQALAAQTVPIYFGNPTAKTDFNLSSFVHVLDARDIQRAIDQVICLDSDDTEYLKMFRTTCCDCAEYGRCMQQLEQFLCHVFEQPCALARRRSVYGWQCDQCRRLMIVLRALTIWCASLLGSAGIFCMERLESNGYDLRLLHIFQRA